jgi:hypothetical protein
MRRRRQPLTRIEPDELARAFAELARQCGDLLLDGAAIERHRRDAGHEIERDAVLCVKDGAGEIGRTALLGALALRDAGVAVARPACICAVVLIAHGALAERKPLDNVWGRHSGDGVHEEQRERCKRQLCHRRPSANTTNWDASSRGAPAVPSARRISFYT